MARPLTVLGFLCWLACSACIYRHTTEPLDINFDQTPLFLANDKNDIKELRSFAVDIQWDSNAIGEIARQHGIKTIYYADLETTSFFGVWSRHAVHIYGR